MTDEVLKKANELKNEIYEIRKFLYSCKINRDIRFFKRKTGIAVIVVFDYMRSTDYFELSTIQREKFINMLEEDLVEKEKELQELK